MSEQRKPTVRGIASLSVLAGCALLTAAMCAFPAAAFPQSIDQLLEAGRVTEAMPQIEAALKRNSRDAKALLQRSTARFIQGDMAGGRSDLDRALQIDPKLRQGWLNRGALALADQDYDKALDAFRHARALDPDALDNDLNLGVVHLMKGDLSTANTEFESYLKRSGDSADALYLVGTNYAMMGYSGLALGYLKRAVELNERVRLRARTDPNWTALRSNTQFQGLLNTDSYRPPAGAYQASQTYEAAYNGGNADILSALLDTLQEQKIPFDSRIEVAPLWALIWGQARIKVQAVDNAHTRIEVTAAPSSMTPEQWRSLTDSIFRGVTVQLKVLSHSAESPPPATPR